MIEHSLFLDSTAFILGTCIGSFLNVVIFRLPAGESIVTPSSHCPKCHTTLPFYFNIPILSYLFLKGRCGFCNTAISIRYPGVECLTGLTALVVFTQFGLTLETLFYIVFSSTLIAISFIDIDHQIIPDVISIPGIFIFSSSVFCIPDMTFFKAISGILAGGGILYAVAYGYYFLKGVSGMGGGDIKLLAMIGAATGVKGIVFTLFSGAVLGTVGGMVFMLTARKKDFKLKIPFGPFLSAGAMLYILWGEPLIHWYLNGLT
ncbi:MAG: prepilin peptidase [Desulfobacterales bacterium]|nr:MAG: prepilin peptidase [Desulfobacterales bacterium]